MNAPATVLHNPIVRSKLQFHLGKQVPRYWVENHPFRTRVFDALSMTFPDGERYFIESVRLFRDQITDPQLQKDVASFIRQEAEHGIAHERYNELLREQGMPVDRLLTQMKNRFKHLLKNESPELNLAITAASEHLTALMADCFYAYRETMEGVDPQMRALFAWHSIEEMEHRAVAFDVMDTVAQVDHRLRVRALVITSVLMSAFTLYRAHEMLKADGFGVVDRVKLFATGIPWLFGPGGILAPMGKPYLKWFKRGFHPNDIPPVHQYDVWVKVYEETGDPLKAGQAFWEAGYPGKPA